MSRQRSYTSPPKSVLVAGANEHDDSRPHYVGSFQDHPSSSPLQHSNVLASSPLSRTSSVSNMNLSSAITGHISTPQDIIPPRQSPAVTGTSLSKRYSLTNMAPTTVLSSSPFGPSLSSSPRPSSTRRRSGSIRSTRGTPIDFIPEIPDSSTSSATASRIPDPEGLEALQKLLSDRSDNGNFGGSEALRNELFYRQHTGTSSTAADSVEELNRFKQVAREHENILPSLQQIRLSSRETSSTPPTGSSRMASASIESSGSHDVASKSDVQHQLPKATSRSPTPDVINMMPTSIPDAMQYRFPPREMGTHRRTRTFEGDLQDSNESERSSSRSEVSSLRSRSDRRVSFGATTMATPESVSMRPATSSIPLTAGSHPIFARRGILSSSPKISTESTGSYGTSPKSPLSQVITAYQEESTRFIDDSASAIVDSETLPKTSRISPPRKSSPLPQPKPSTASALITMETALASIPPVLYNAPRRTMSVSVQTDNMDHDQHDDIQFSESTEPRQSEDGLIFNLSLGELPASHQSSKSPPVSSASAGKESKKEESSKTSKEKQGRFSFSYFQ